MLHPPIHTQPPRMRLYGLYLHRLLMRLHTPAHGMSFIHLHPAYNVRLLLSVSCLSSDDDPRMRRSLPCYESPAVPFPPFLRRCGVWERLLLFTPWCALSLIASFPLFCAFLVWYIVSESGLVSSFCTHESSSRRPLFALSDVFGALLLRLSTLRRAVRKLR